MIITIISFGLTDLTPVFTMYKLCMSKVAVQRCVTWDSGEALVNPMDVSRVSYLGNRLSIRRKHHLSLVY